MRREQDASGPGETSNLPDLPNGFEERLRPKHHSRPTAIGDVVHLAVRAQTPLAQIVSLDLD
jgi:hypothetical protein